MPAEMRAPTESGAQRAVQDPRPSGPDKARAFRDIVGSSIVRMPADMTEFAAGLGTSVAAELLEPVLGEDAPGPLDAFQVGYSAVQKGIESTPVLGRPMEQLRLKREGSAKMLDNPFMSFFAELIAPGPGELAAVPALAKGVKVADRVPGIPKRHPLSPDMEERLGMAVAGDRFEPLVATPSKFDARSTVEIALIPKGFDKEVQLGSRSYRIRSDLVELVPHPNPKFADDPEMRVVRATKESGLSNRIEELPGFSGGHAADPDFAYRGMSYEEMAEASERGFFQSEGPWNFEVENARGATLFGANPATANYYGTSTPWPMIPTPEKPGFIIKVRRSGGTNFAKQVEGGDYLEAHGPIPWEDVESVAVIQPIATRPGRVELTSSLSETLREGSRSSPDIQVAYKEVTPDEVAGVLAVNAGPRATYVVPERAIVSDMAGPVSGASDPRVTDFLASRQPQRVDLTRNVDEFTQGEQQQRLQRVGEEITDNSPRIVDSTDYTNRGGGVTLTTPRATFVPAMSRVEKIVARRTQPHTFGTRFDEANATIDPSLSRMFDDTGAAKPNIVIEPGMTINAHELAELTDSISDFRSAMLEVVGPPEMARLTQNGKLPPNFAQAQMDEVLQAWEGAVGISREVGERGAVDMDFGPATEFHGAMERSNIGQLSALISDDRVWAPSMGVPILEDALGPYRVPEGLLVQVKAGMPEQLFEQTLAHELGHALLYIRDKDGTAKFMRQNDFFASTAEWDQARHELLTNTAEVYSKQRYERMLEAGQVQLVQDYLLSEPEILADGIGRVILDPAGAKADMPMFYEALKRWTASDPLVGDRFKVVGGVAMPLLIAGEVISANEKGADDGT
jgi:hypothetical protein